MRGLRRLARPPQSPLFVLLRCVLVLLTSKKSSVGWLSRGPHSRRAPRETGSGQKKGGHSGRRLRPPGRRLKMAAKAAATQTAKAVEYSVKAPTIRRRAHRLHQSSHRHRDGWILGRLRTPKTAGSRVSSVSSGGQFLESDFPGVDAALLPKTKMKARLGSANSHAAEQPGEPGAASSSELNSRPRLVCLFRS